MGRKPNTRRDAYGAWLYHLRREKGLTQEELAREMGVPRSNLAYWERSGNLTGRKIILRMAKSLGVSVSELLRVKN
jgi:transcriptional regulator with XRE-family HTH domain